MHEPVKLHISHIGLVGPIGNLEAAARVIPVGMQRQRCQRDQVDAVIVLNGIQVAVLGADTDDVGNAGQLSCRCAHPQHIMIAPLDIHRMIVHENVHDLRRAGATVKNIADDVQMIYHQPLNERAERHNELRRPVNADDRVDDLVIICLFVGDFLLLRDQLFYNIGEILGQSFPHLGTRIFGRYPLTDLNEPVQRDLVPVVQIRLLFQDPFHLPVRIINQRRQTLLVPDT